MAIPLLDHVISNLKERFDDRNQIISKINNLLSLNIIGVDKQELKTLCTEIKEFYNQDITNTFEEELYLWQEKWKNVENEKITWNRDYIDFKLFFYFIYYLIFLSININKIYKKLS
jgi:hypothetical protein